MKMHLTVLITAECESEAQAHQVYDKIERKVEDIENIQITGDIHLPAKENQS